MATFRIAADPDDLPALIRQLRDQGTVVVDDPASVGAGETYAGVVRDRAGAQLVVVAALRGADLLLAYGAEPPARQVVDQLADEVAEDLERLGTLTYLVAPQTVLPEEQVALLSRLHSGDSLGAAATALHLSRRTADRRLAMARAALGVRTTAEALVEAATLGILDQGLS
jgi:hypothetical protein